LNGPIESMRHALGIGQTAERDETSNELARRSDHRSAPYLPEVIAAIKAKEIAHMRKYRQWKAAFDGRSRMSRGHDGTPDKHTSKKVARIIAFTLKPRSCEVEWRHRTRDPRAAGIDFRVVVCAADEAGRDPDGPDRSPGATQKVARLERVAN